MMTHPVDLRLHEPAGKICVNDHDEIAQKGWFAMDASPQDITQKTRRRIEELLGQRKLSHVW